MQKLKADGATTFAQNEETCVVYGMPRAAVELGAVDRVLPLEEIPARAPALGPVPHDPRIPANCPRRANLFQPQPKSNNERANSLMDVRHFLNRHLADVFDTMLSLQPVPVPQAAPPESADALPAPWALSATR